MPYPHTIRLRGPWQYSVLSGVEEDVARARGEPLANQGRVNLPADWGDALGADFRGTVRYTRRFNRPTGLDPHERVWCIIDGADPAGNATLNGQLLGEVQGYALPAEFDITPLLQERNELTLDIEMPASDSFQTPRPGRESLPGGPIGEVRLEVRAGHFLHALSVWVSEERRVPKLRVTGQIAGEAKSTPLAVVVQAFERELFYGEFQSGDFVHLYMTASELPYREPEDAACRLAPVEIRLLSGGVNVWQTVRETAIERVVWDANQPRLIIAGKEVTFPVSMLPVGGLQPPFELPAEFLACPTTAWGNRQILSDAWYSALDRHNVRVIQLVPASWTSQVCARLAHHPSIVAWAAQADDWDQLPQEFRDQGLFGRPLLRADEAFAIT